MTTTELVQALLASVGGNPDAAIQAIIEAINHPQDAPYDANGISKPDGNGGVRVRGVEELRVELEKAASQDPEGKVSNAAYQYNEMHRLVQTLDCQPGLDKLTPGTREYAICSTGIGWANLAGFGYIGGWIVHDVNPGQPGGVPWVRDPDKIISGAYALPKTFTTGDQITAEMRRIVATWRPPHGGGPVAG